MKDKYSELKNKKDIVIYSDKNAKEQKAVFRWDMSGKPTKKSKQVTLNGYKWNLVWLKPKK